MLIQNYRIFIFLFLNLNCLISVLSNFYAVNTFYLYYFKNEKYDRIKWLSRIKFYCSDLIIFVRKKEIIQVKPINSSFFFSFVKSLQINSKKMSLCSFLVGLTLMGKFWIFFLLLIFRKSKKMDFLFSSEQILGNPRLQINTSALLADHPLLSKSTITELCDRFVVWISNHINTYNLKFLSSIFWSPRDRFFLNCWLF